MSIEGKVAIVTGAGKGIGRATTVELAKSGAKLVLAGIRNESIEKVKDEILPVNKHVITVRTDVSVWEETRNMAAETLQHYGRIDLLVNNAGVEKINREGKRYSVLELEDSDWNRILGVNLVGQYHCIKAVAPSMMEQKFGRIVNLSSTTGIYGVFGTVAYCASKAGIMVMTKSMASELGPYNICVNCVAPGLTLTPMHDHTPPEHIEMAKKMLPLRRVGEPVDIARAVLFFLSEHQFSTGQTLVVDGGGTMH